MDENTLVHVLVAERVKTLGFIQSIVRRPEMVEDIFQDVCTLAVQKRAAIDGEVHLMKWLRTTARFVALNALRKRQERHLSLDDALLNTLEAEWQEIDQEDVQQRAEALRHCLELLSPMARQLVHWRYVEGLDYTRLAAAVKRPVKSLYVTFSRIHVALGDCIHSQLDSERKNG